MIVVGYTALGGFRADATARDVATDSIEALGIGMLVALVVLVVLGRLDGESSPREIVGMVALEAIPVAFGVSIARVQLSGAESQDEAEAEKQEQRRAGPIGPFGRLFIAAGGALLFALNIAPTEEPVDIGAQASAVELLAMVALSLVATGALVFLAEFAGRRGGGDTLLEKPLVETISAYAISLAVAFLLLWAFGRTDGASLQAVLGMTIALGIVAALGGAAGRLLVAPGPEAEGD